MDAGAPRAALDVLAPELHVVSHESLYQAPSVARPTAALDVGAIASTTQSAGAVEYFLSGFER